MHMADALISPVVGGVGWVFSGLVISFSSSMLKRRLDERKVPLMGVLAAFVFAAQMINFTIPMTGSSGHLAGALLLAVLLGSHGGFIAISSVLTIQAFFFADGGLWALGCNIFNIGFIACYVAYPLVYLLLTGDAGWRIVLSCMVSAVAALQLGSLAVVAETYFSGISSISFDKFLMLMQPIHLAIGLVEGAVTASVVLFLQRAGVRADAGRYELRRVVVIVSLMVMLSGGLLSWYASSNPDGLEWSLLHTEAELAEADSSVQVKTALMPDYSFRGGDSAHPRLETSTAGVAGSAATMALVMGCLFAIRRRG